jgi:glycosyltransferase involved in cell wall biosynthesis
MITYNHERFLAQAIDSALAQRTPFDVEIVVGEDCSKDRTREILRAYTERYPGRVRALLPEKNLGINRNLVATLRACQGEYVALLEGDDFWTDPNKLQKQVEFLDARPDFELCFHDVTTIRDDDPTSVRQRRTPVRGKSVLSLNDLLLIGNFIPTCSAVFRNRDFSQMPDWFFSLRIGDYPLNMMTAERGKLGYLPGAMGCYRLHTGGTFSAQSNQRNVEEMVRMMDLVKQYFGGRYDQTIEIMQNYHRAVECFRQGDVARGKQLAAACLRERPLSARVAKAALMAYLPGVYQALRRVRDGVAAASARAH